MAKQKYHPGGQARCPAPSKKPAKRKASAAGKLALGIVTLCNIGLSVALHLLRRQEILHAVEDNGDVKLLLLEKKRQDGNKS